MNYPNVGIVILAAGAATRMGYPKQLLQINNESLIHRICRKALSVNVGAVTVVLGANSAQIAPEVADLADLHIVHNPDWKDGMSTSVQTGLRAMLKLPTSPEGILFLLVDQPFVEESAILAFLHAFAKYSPLLLAADYGKKIGVPALFASSMFNELEQLDGQLGARKLLDQYQAKAHRIPLPKAAFDLDTPEDWERFKEHYRMKK
ncbi:MAG: nucleotidyltransferase family protein [Saprospiraceae bacterium]|nr:nucleotidyltransferase family protein [Saprospiraceae bacterium]